MAELILTDEEKAAALWSDLDDASLGRLMKKKLAFLQTASSQMDRVITYSAGLLLCCAAGEANATSMTLDLDEVSQDGRDFGNWRVKVEKLS